MKVDSEIKMFGIEVLNRYLGVVDTERFIALIQREKFDYTKWRQNLFGGMSGEEVSKIAMEFQKHQKKHRSVK